MECPFSLPGLFRGCVFLGMDTIKLHNGEQMRFYPGRPAGEGAEKEFFHTENNDFIVGFYKDQISENDPNRLRRLLRIVENFNPTKDTKKGEFWKTHFCWPAAVVLEPRCGILSPKFPLNFYFDDEKGEKKGKRFLNPRLVKKLKPHERGNLFQRIQVLRQLVRAVGRMHAAGLAHSDLSGNNILVDPEKGVCILIDIDSLVVKNVNPPVVLGTRGYIAPEVVKTSVYNLNHPERILPDIKTDLYSLSVIIYEMLLLRHPLIGKKIHSNDCEQDDFFMFGEKALFIENPEDPSNRPEKLEVSYHSLGPYLSSLIEQAFVDGLHEPDLRPTAYQWEEALANTADILFPCRGENCWYKWQIDGKNHKSVCPVCYNQATDKIPALHLFRHFKPGQFISERKYLTLWDQRKLFKWHIRKDVILPDNLMDNYEAMGTFFFQQDKWIFKNESSIKMMDHRFKIIPPGGSTEIDHRNVLVFCAPPEGRVGLIELR